MDLVELNSTVNQLYRMGMCRRLHPATADPHSSQGHMVHSPRQTTFWAMNTPNAFKRREIMQCAFSEHNGTKLEIHKRKMAEKPQTLGD